MQKKLLALAIAGLAAAPAFAQSNVTIYGVADLTLDFVKADGGNTTTGWTLNDYLADESLGGANYSQRQRVSSNSSYIGFKGAESLGNGLTAVFQFESGINVDSGSTGAFNNGNLRDSYVGLAGGFGVVALGNLTGPTRGLGTAMDVNAGATGIGANTALLGKLGNAAMLDALPAAINPGTTTSVFDTRWKNTIAYISPNMSGFTVTAAYVANEGKSADPVTLNPWGWDIGVKYENGPFMFALTNNTVKTGATADTSTGTTILEKASDWRLGGYWKFMPNSRIGLLWDRVKADFSDRYWQGGWARQDVYYVSGVFGLVPNGRLIAQYGVARDVKTSEFTADNTGAKHYVIGWEQDLSKRTMLKAVYSRINNDDHANYDFFNPVGKLPNASGNLAAGATPQGLSIGIRHSF